MTKRTIMAGIVVIVLAGAAGWLALAGSQPAASGRWAQPGGPDGTPLNPGGLPQIAACTTIPLDNPIADAQANIARGDLRPFTVYGFTSGDVPGVFCPAGDYRLESRGGLFVSDMPDACGKTSFANAPIEGMTAYNRALAVDPRFQKITGCRPSSHCEERYAKGAVATKQRDPQCPAEPRVLLEVARSGSGGDLAAALSDFADRSPRSRDAVTAAFVAALERAKWSNAELLLRAGADINGRAFDRYPDQRQWLGSPLAAVFNQNADRAAKLPRARWLFTHGLTFANPGGHQALVWAASENDVDAVGFLLVKGASPNGALSPEKQDRLARGDIRSAGGGYGYGMSPFYEALEAATRNWARRTPEENRFADEEQRKGRLNAVTLYRAGGRFSVGKLYDDMREKPDIRVASILLAAADREGRLKDVIERILYPGNRDTPLNIGRTAGERALIDYLRQVEACPIIRPAPRGDRVLLCSSGGI